MLENMVTDRTLAHYLRWKELRDKGWANMTEAEREEWWNGVSVKKGSYGYTDLNRVGAALNYLRERLAVAGYLTGAEFSARENWGVEDVPTADDLTYYLSSVATIRGALATLSTTPAMPPDVCSLDYLGANAIEQILVDVDQLVTNMLAVRYFCGDLYSGEV